MIGTAALLVFGVARMLGAGSDASSDGGDAAQLAGAPAASTSAGQPSTRPGGTAKPGGKATTKQGPRLTAKPTPSPTPLPAPDGPCTSKEVAVKPVVSEAHAGSDVTIVLELTSPRAACTWEVSSTSVVVRLTSGDDFIWSTQHCPKALPTTSVVVRKETPARVALTWPARRSDEECSNQAGWVGPGWYHVTTAALAGEPADVQFELDAAVRPTVTITPKPKKSPKPSTSGAPTEEPLDSGDGASEPNG